MGLFSKETKIETADALFDKFNALSEEERNLFIGKIVPKQEPVAEPTSETTKQGENENVEPNVTQSQTQPAETNEQAAGSSNKTVMVKNTVALDKSGLQSNYQSIKELHPEWSDKQVTAELDELGGGKGQERVKQQNDNYAKGQL